MEKKSTDNKTQDNGEQIMDTPVQENDQNATGAEGGSADLTPETEKLSNELEEQKDKYLRLVAEFDNYKRRTAKEKNELAQTAGKEIITAIAGSIG